MVDKSKLTRALARKTLQVKKQSPHIFFLGGVAGAITSTVLACKATLKVEAVLDEATNNLDSLRKGAEEAREQGADNVDENYYKQLGAHYTRTGLSLAKLYGPSVVVGVVSIGALTGSHVQLTRRNTALSITLAALSKSFDEYRIRVQKEIGEERELDIHRGASDIEVEGEDGRKKLVKNTDIKDGVSPYRKLFEESNLNWVPNAEMNYNFIKAQENFLNQRLHAKGHVLLNEVYDALGLSRTPAGAICGWVDGSQEGDSYISFGLDSHDPAMVNFVNGHERNVWLDFNVDGVVYELIGG